MSGFSAEWLILRERYDVAARNGVVLKAAIEAFKGKPNLRIVDLGCGTGSTMRTLSPWMSAGQKWRLVDHDRILLERAAQGATVLNVHATAIHADLNREIETLLSGPADLVTVSALLDLVSDEWLERLVNSVAADGLHVYAALSYDGRIEIAPAHPLDEAVVKAVNLHQRTDKGFGPALGQLAASAAISKLVQRGYFVHQGPADWIASEQDVAFQTEIVLRWAIAAGEIGAISAQDIEEWLAFRQEQIAAGGASLRVGHLDFLGVPPSAL